MPATAFIFNLLLGVLLIVSCSKSTTPQPMGKLELYLQDAAGQFDSVFINIERIDIHWTQAADTNSGWDVLLTTPVTCDVAALRNGNSRKLLSRSLAPGLYDTLRVRFGQCMAVRNDTLFALDFWPDSSHNSGKAAGTVKIRNDETTEALIDIDLFHAIVFNADSSRYFFTPIFRFIDLDSTGSIFGYINTAAFLFLLNDDDSLAFTLSDGAGNYFGFFGLPSGFYDLLFKPIDSLTFDSLYIEDLSIVPPSAINLDTLILPLRW